MYDHYKNKGMKRLSFLYRSITGQLKTYWKLIFVEKDNYLINKFLDQRVRIIRNRLQELHFLDSLNLTFVIIAGDPYYASSPL